MLTTCCQMSVKTLLAHCPGLERELDTPPPSNHILHVPFGRSLNLQDLEGEKFGLHPQNTSV
jgi:hypothetical protein